MDTTYIIAVIVLVVVGIILMPIFSRRKRSQKLQDKFGSEYDHTMETTGNDKETQKELNERVKHVEMMNIRSLSLVERKRYLEDWAVVQSKFVDEPGQAIGDADRLIMEVMQLRAYPVSDFDQRAADISVNYPDLISNYRAARAIALKNEQQKADTEEMRQAMIHYRSLFKELLETESEIVLEK